MYQQVKDTVNAGRPVDLGIYINPDDIAKTLRTAGEIDLARTFKVRGSRMGWRAFAVRSGLLQGEFDLNAFKSGCRFIRHTIVLKDAALADQYAQLLTAYLCELMLKHRKKFSFETVFSHPSKLTLMNTAAKLGFKTYLYFIATNSPEINKDRVRTRVLQGGHDVPEDRIEKRYELALKQMLPALNTCYHGFAFDNSGAEPVVFAEVKQLAEARVWSWSFKAIPDWFIKHYLLASGNPLFADVARIALEERKKAQQ